MRDQYAGDVSDVLKFSFLRALASHDRTLGVAWYYVPSHDGRRDGKHLEWRDEPAWRHLDPDLHVGLSELPERSVASLERAAIWPQSTQFHREPVPPRSQRNSWGENMRTALAGAVIVFLDLDTGVGKASKRHATFNELYMLRTLGRAIVFISFPGRKDHDVLVEELHEDLCAEAGATSAITLRTSVSVPRASDPRYSVPRQRWFTVVDPDATLIARTSGFADALASVPRVSVKLDGVT